MRPILTFISLLLCGGLSCADFIPDLERVESELRALVEEKSIPLLHVPAGKRCFFKDLGSIGDLVLDLGNKYPVYDVDGTQIGFVQPLEYGSHINLAGSVAFDGQVKVFYKPSYFSMKRYDVDDVGVRKRGYKLPGTHFYVFLAYEDNRVIARIENFTDIKPRIVPTFKDSLSVKMTQGYERL